MMEFFTFYTSSFWVWAGITLGAAIVVNGAIAVILAILKR